MRTISPKLPEDLLTELETEAKARRTTKSQLLRKSVETMLRGKRQKTPVSCYDLARDMAGRIKGLPKDLATNPRYMKGFAE
jgi:hypothetical protein